MSISERPMAVQFLADRAQNSEPFRSWLIEMVRESRNNVGDNHTLAANAMTILVRSRMRFNSANLQGIKIRGANLTEGEFDSADLRESDLTDVILDRCWLRNARFEGSCMKGVKFGESASIALRGMPSASAYSQDGQYIAVSFLGKSITVFNTFKMEPICSLQDFSRTITALAFSPDGKWLAFGDRDGLLRIWAYTLNTSTVCLTFRAHDDYISGLVYSPDGNRIATAGQDGVGIWEATTGKNIYVLDEHYGGVSSVAFSPDGKQLVSGGSDKTIRLWDSTTGEAIVTLSGHEGAISAVLFSPDGRQIASASSDETVRIWSATIKAADMASHGHTTPMSSDATVLIWSATSEATHAILSGHKDRVTGIAYSPNGQQLVSCGDDYTIRTWDPHNGSAGPVIARHTAE
ncbi:HIR complex subunit, partial [Mortierella sp. NVP41]